MFETLGINLIVKGMSAFARDVSHVSTSLSKFATSSLRAEKAARRNVMAQEKLAITLVNKTGKAMLALQKRIVAKTNALNASVFAIDRLSRREAAHAQAIKDYEGKVSALAKAEKKLADMRKIYDAIANKRLKTSVEYHRKLKAQATTVATLSEGIRKQTGAYNRALDAQGRMTLATDKFTRVQDELLATEEALVVTTEKYAGALVDLEAAEQNSAEFMKKTGAEANILKSFLTSLTGGWGEYITEQSAVGKAIATIIPQFAAMSLGLNVLKLGFDAVVWSVKFFVGAIKKVVEIVGKLLKPVWDAAKYIGKHLWGAFKKVALLPFNIIIGGLRKFGDSLKRIFEIAIGMNLDRLLWGLGSRIRTIGEQAVEAAIDFQLFTIRLRNLLMTETLQQNAVDYATAIGIAGEKTKELTRWISKLAVLTIFGAEEIANTMVLAMSYDFTSERAKELTIATLDFATGMGLTDEKMRKIIENFGQMRAQGKLAGTELRDLARGAFVPYNAVLLQMGRNLGVIADVDLPSMAAIGQELARLGNVGDISAESLEKLSAGLANVTADGEMTRAEFKKLAAEFPEGFFTALGISPEQLGDILAELPTGELKKTLDKMIADGTASVDDFFTAFEEMVAKRFPDAAKSMSGSMKTVLSNIDDLIETVLGWRVLAPMFAYIAERLTNVINSLMSDEMLDFFDNLGTVFLNVTKVAYALADGFTHLFNTGANKTTMDRITRSIGKFVKALSLLGSEDTKAFTLTLYYLEKSLTSLGLAAIGWDRMSGGFWGLNDLFERIGAGEIESGELGFEEIKDTLFQAVKDIWEPLWTEIIKPELINLWGKIKKNVTDYWTNEVVPAFTEWKEETLFPFLNEFIAVTVPGWAKELAINIPIIAGFLNTQLLTALTGLENWAIEHTGPTSGLSLLLGLFRSLSEYIGLEMSGPTYMGDETPGAADYEDPFKASGLAQSLRDIESAVSNLVGNALAPLSTWLSTNEDMINTYIGFVVVLYWLLPGLYIEPIKDLAIAIAELTGSVLGWGTASSDGYKLLKFLTLIFKVSATIIAVGMAPMLAIIDTVIMLSKAIQYLVIVSKGMIGALLDMPTDATPLERLQGFFDVFRDLDVDALPKLEWGDFAIPSVFEGIWSTPETATDVAAAIDGLLQQVETEFQNADFSPTIESLEAPFINAELDFAAIGKRMGASVISEIENQKSPMYNAGWSIVAGLELGLRDRWVSLLTWWQTRAAELNGVLVTTYQIESPSKVFRKHGLNIAKGLQLGLEKGMGGAVMAMRRGAIDLQQGMGVINNNAQQYSNSNTTTNNYSLGVQTQTPVNNVIQGYEVLRAMAR